MSETNSYRTILRSSAIMGSASVAHVAISLVRMKVVAVLLGPTGVGLVGLLHNLMQSAGGIAALGLGTVGVRRLAHAHGNARPDEVLLIQRALLWGTVILALLGAGVVFLLRVPIARLVLVDASKADMVGWLALGVGLGVATGSQIALLNGMRRIRDIALLQICAAFISSVLGVWALFVWGEAALIAYVILAPATSFAIATLFVARLPAIQGTRPTWSAIVAEWWAMLPLGSAFVISGMVLTGGILVVRSLVQHQLGPEALGHFQAAWVVGMTYLGFVLGAMSTDYFPRLSACIGDPLAACRLVNEQTEVALLLTAPALIALLSISPWLVPLLYTNEFLPAVAILRWQLLGDLLKVMSWPLGMVALAAGAGRTYIMTESLGIGVLILGVAVGLSVVGVIATGMAFLAMYVAYLTFVYWIARRRIGFRWIGAVVAHAIVYFSLACAISVFSFWSEPLAAIIGVAIAVLLGAYALGRLGQKAELSGPVARLAAITRSFTKRLGFKYG